MTALFAAASFLSAFLLFSVQPLVARMLLPLLGGAPAVWNTCLVFFQFLLLAGYLYSHWLSGQTPRIQRLIQLGALLAAGLFLPIQLRFLGSEQPPAEMPILWLLGALLATVGLPFFALSAHAPLLQVWLARYNRNPYFLYSASNAGSLLALAAYPILIEPTMPLPMQSVAWLIGFAALVLLIALASSPAGTAQTAVVNEESEPPRRLLWILFAFVPSSLLQGVTTYLTTDIASLPLLWIIPLAIYLLTFVIAFSERLSVSSQKLRSPLAIFSIPLIFILAMELVQPLWLILGLHLAFFASACLYAHSRLAEARPSPARLTDFYLCMSIGGVLGGAFNALLAPLLFNSILEYPLAILLACFLPYNRREKYALGVPATSLIAAGLILGTILYNGVTKKALYAERTFFGVLRVTVDPTGPFHRLWHGTTVHGLQHRDPNRACEPLGYYLRESGLGKAWRIATNRMDVRSVAVIGLGAGTTLAYSEPNQKWTVYEIDPGVIKLASNTNYFTYIGNCARGRLQFEVGDARLRLAEAAPQSIDFLILDAFSSDSVPTHLLTREAIRLYAEKVSAHGMMVFHVSSRNLELLPVVIATIEAEGLIAFESAAPLDTDDVEGRYDSDWLVVMRRKNLPPEFLDTMLWRRSMAPANTPVWTDDFSDIWSIIDLR